MRNRSHVFNHVYFKTCRLQRADSGFTAGARTFDHNFNSLHAMLHSRFCSRFRGHLRGKRRRLTGAFETEITGACPRDRVAVRIRNGNDRIVEGGADMCHTRFDIFPVTTFRAYDFFWFSHCLLSPLLISSCSLPYDEDPCEYGHSFSYVVREPASRDGDAHRGSSRFRSNV
ncbi:hypothetical protein DJ90_5615 [Paenibacillus macerans]|uniref:Uncharacterized protein n=1 Tax=Paenibacillus macerans TaxID=44252 RepID=A0A090XUU4_PAEMA|nr:hypothetical protein DJ90_5615 [Paenibacillus macerans]